MTLSLPRPSLLILRQRHRYHQLNHLTYPNGFTSTIHHALGLLENTWVDISHHRGAIFGPEYQGRLGRRGDTLKLCQCWQCSTLCSLRILLRVLGIGPSIRSLSDKLRNISARLVPATSGHLFNHPRSTCPLARTMYTTFTLVYLVQAELYLSASWPQLIRYATPADHAPGPASSRRAVGTAVMVSRHLDELRAHMWMAAHV
jgi:hypothetical protein